MKTLALLVLMLILLGSEAHAQNGAIMFSQHGTPGVGEAPYGVVAGDFDDDGDLDLAVCNAGSGLVIILSNDGHGVFAETTSVLLSGQPWSGASGDFDGDGDLDLAITEYSANRVALLENDGSGAFTLATTIGTEQRPHFVITGDFDGDLNLATANDILDSVSILENESTPVAIETDEPGVPRAYRSEQNYPNPFNPSTIIPYRLSNATPVTLRVYDVLGRDVATLVDALQAPGRYEVTFDADGLSVGVYLYRLQTDARVLSRAMLLFN